MTSFSLFDVPLSFEKCQEIDFRAQVALLDQKEERAQMGNYASAQHPSVGVHNVQTCIRHPADITRVYRGVTTRHVLEVQDLWCHRLARSVEAVVDIMNARANQVGAEQLMAEAMLAICMYFADLRQQRTSVSIQQAGTTWILVPLTLPFEIKTANGSNLKPLLFLIVDLSHDQVLAFRTSGAENNQESFNLAFYDALAATRAPSAEALSGLVWFLPAIVQIDPHSENPGFLRTCSELSIQVEHVSYPQLVERSIAVQKILEFWSKSRSPLQGAMPNSRFELVFDRSLYAIQGREPRRVMESQALQFARLRGYSEDPALMLPALRWLLPCTHVELTNGSVLHRGMHYGNALLHLWPGRAASLRVSAETEALGWVYFGSEVICEAVAAELRRNDGSFRSHP